MQHRVENGDTGCPSEGGHARHHLVKHRPEGEDVAPRVYVRATRSLLGRHVRRRADDAPLCRRRGCCRGASGFEGIRGRGREELGNPKIEKLHVPARRDHHVLRLQVSVDNALLVCGAQTLGDLLCDTDGLWVSPGAIRSRSVSPCTSSIAMKTCPSASPIS